MSEKIDIYEQCREIIEYPDKKSVMAMAYNFNDGDSVHFLKVTITVEHTGCIGVGKDE